MEYRPPPDPGEVELNLARALIESSNAPLLLLDGAKWVVAASRSFCSAFQIDPATAVGRLVFELGAGEWDVPQFRSLLKSTADGHAQIETYTMDLRRTGHETRNLVLNAQKLVYGDEENIRLLLAVSDVTDARTAERHRDDLIAEKEAMFRTNATLLMELQHRVANSLQIIASVLLQSARLVNSDEARSHLNAAHQRIMSVAALQRQLSLAETDKVSLRLYLNDLCNSLSASMILDHNRMAIRTDVDDTVLPANVSVSLGLIATELVINAMKHAFPGDRRGSINVGYHATEADWTLSVTDDGIGMGSATTNRPGLGTTIITSLAKHLGATINVVDASPGTQISIVHTSAVAPPPDAGVLLRGSAT